MWKLIKYKFLILFLTFIGKFVACLCVLICTDIYQLEAQRIANQAWVQFYSPSSTVAQGLLESDKNVHSIPLRPCEILPMRNVKVVNELSFIVKTLIKYDWEID